MEDLATPGRSEYATNHAKQDHRSPGHPRTDERRDIEIRKTIDEYHEAQLKVLLDRVRDGFAQLDAGELDPFELDELIHRYKRSAQKLWSSCGSSGSGWERAALTLESLHEQGEEDPDWWAAGEPVRQGR